MAPSKNIFQNTSVLLIQKTAPSKNVFEKHMLSYFLKDSCQITFSKTVFQKFLLVLQSMP